MDRTIAIEKARQQRISVVQIVREEYEMVLLSSIFESPFGNRLIFRGGTALRLAYDSPRFSDDLDFSQMKSVHTGEFQKWCRDVARRNENIEFVEALKKYFTLFALFRVKDPVLPATISIKVEISTRKERWKKESDYTLMRLGSAVTPLTVLAQVATLPLIEKEKLAIRPARIRDVFDLWYIGQQLKKPNTMDFQSFPSKKVKSELHRLLPEHARKIIEPWLQKS